MRKKYMYIFEQTRVCSPSEINILQEGKLENGKAWCSFKALLQEASVKNNNKRRYPEPICESIVNQLSPKAKNRSLLMEIDHPMFGSFSTDPDKLKQRAGIIEVKNCGAVISEIKYKDGQILSEIKTLSGFKGPDLANLLLKDRVNIGFSLRALGSVQPLMDGTLEVTSPITPITYDIVSNPSHVNARVLEFIPETDMKFLESSSTILCEGVEFDMLTKDQININHNSYRIREFANKVNAEQFINTISKNIRFKI